MGHHRKPRAVQRDEAQRKDTASVADERATDNRITELHELLQDAKQTIRDYNQAKAGLEKMITTLNKQREQVNEEVHNTIQEIITREVDSVKQHIKEEFDRIADHLKAGERRALDLQARLLGAEDEKDLESKIARRVSSNLAQRLERNASIIQNAVDLLHSLPPTVTLGALVDYTEVKKIPVKDKRNTGK